MGKEHIATGWQEWARLPELGLPPLQTKIDSGRQTSTLHAFMTEEFERDEQVYVRFCIHPKQNDHSDAIMCEAPILGKYEGTNKHGDPDNDYLIRTTIQMGQQQWPVELVITNMDDMTFRLLLGHSAIDGRLIVDPAATFLLGGPDDIIDNPPQKAEK
ncbi:MAG: hypothetical protein ACJAZ4_000181 [Neptuniibacter pectenicola]|jgi:hypothetical protein|uniref:ATP-dependent zinc protease family protein n=1 Tax=Neptuniibacter pectenicola TaxID=1806669 RepID=UPI003AE5D51F